MKRTRACWAMVATALAIALCATSASAQTIKPHHTLKPTITGSPVVGHTLKASTGKWAGHPSEYKYVWLACKSVSSDCVNARTGGKAAVGKQTFTIIGGDVGYRIVVGVIAYNSVGYGIAVSRPTATVGGSSPGTKPRRGEGCDAYMYPFGRALHLHLRAKGLRAAGSAFAHFP